MLTFKNHLSLKKWRKLKIFIKFAVNWGTSKFPITTTKNHDTANHKADHEICCENMHSSWD